ncbi:MAG: response regulator [Desulfobulbaceae bacterium]|nr:response regulator [Desulfobulbaceae bacterium]
MVLETGKSRILIADDDQITREVLNGFLKHDYELQFAANGEQTLEVACGENPPDLVLLDIMMPDLDGYEVCGRMKENPATHDIPIIFVTALTKEEDETKGLELGAADYITKPLKLPVLAARIKTHLKLKQQRDQIEGLVKKRTVELKKTETLVKARDALVRDLFEAMDEMLANRDHYTFLHALRVAEISKRIAADLSLSPDDINALELGCLVHDIGKIAIPDDVLLKPGRFDHEDRRIMELHPLMGAQLFAKRIADDRMTKIILHHHERLDGSGYPAGIKGDEIDMLVRIVSVADVYEALVAKRPYKQPMPRDKALLILREDAANNKMDPVAVEAIARVTESWNPLDIERDFSADYMADLETFRRMTYFREPLSDFYNYRYLLSLEEDNLLEKGTSHYHIIMVDFIGLRDFNKKLGYIKADDVISEIGLKLHQTVLDLNENEGGIDSSAMMLRKGADYLIYSTYPDEKLTILHQRITGHLQEAKEKWGLEARFINRQFGANYPTKNAVNELFSQELD